MRNTLLFFLCIISSKVLFPQISLQGPVPPFAQNEIYFESNFLPNSQGGTGFISYRIAYNHLVFIKEDDIFTAKFSITIEAVDSVTEKYYREIDELDLTVSTYDETADDGRYIQGVLPLKLPSGKYRINPIINDYNAGKEIRSIPLYANLLSSKEQVIVPPVIVKHSASLCKSDSVSILANIQGNIPFSLSEYDMWIPVADTSVKEIEVQINNNDSVFSKIFIKEYTRGEFEIGECENEIYFRINERSKSFSFFRLSSVNKKLMEGKVEITISAGNRKEEKFVRYAFWQNKPKSLLNVQYAIKMLKYLSDEPELDKLKKSEDIESYMALVKYWKKFDPTPATPFNELMSEYYARVDYAIENFSIIGAANGAETDRGKIFVQFGKPDDIKRVYSDNNDIKEIWIYNSTNDQFVFTDKSGLGNFILSNSL